MGDFLTFIYVVLCCVLIFVVCFLMYIKFSSQSPYPVILRYPEELHFLDGTKKKQFPKLDDEATISLSVIVPAYNEQSRMPAMLDECLDNLETRSEADSSFTYEVIVVDDGSSDGTTKVALEYSEKYSSEKVRVLTLVANRGKGGATRLGMLSARGRLLLFADADGATKFRDVEKLEAELSGSDTRKIAIGSRAHLEEDAIASRSFFRTFLMLGFHFLVWLFAVRTVRDTQCGFKLFTRTAARELFPQIHVERWAFDVELLHLAERLRIPIKEVAVNWTEIEGSKLVPFWSWLQMGRDLMLIWLKYRLGIWKVMDGKKTS